MSLNDTPVNKWYINKNAEGYKALQFESKTEYDVYREFVNSGVTYFDTEYAAWVNLKALLDSNELKGNSYKRLLDRQLEEGLQLGPRKKNTSDSAESLIDEFIMDTANRWEQACDGQQMYNLEDLPAMPGDISIQDVIDELKYRLSSKAKTRGI